MVNEIAGGHVSAPTTPQDAPGSTFKDRRAVEVKDMLKRGMSQTEIGRHYGLSRERVRQLVDGFGLRNLYLRKRVERTAEAGLSRWLRRGHNQYTQQCADRLEKLGHTVERTVVAKNRNLRVTFKVDGKYAIRCCKPQKLSATSPNAAVLYYHLNLSLPDTVYYVVMPEQRAIVFPSDIPASGSMYLRPNGEGKRWGNGSGPTYRWVLTRQQVKDGDNG